MSDLIENTINKIDVEESLCAGVHSISFSSSSPVNSSKTSPDDHSSSVDGSSAGNSSADISSAVNPPVQTPSVDALTSPQENLPLPHQPLTIIVDVSFGFPLQPRPRRERINAVSNQVKNYVLSFVKCGGEWDKVQLWIGGSEGDYDRDAGEVKSRLSNLLPPPLQSKIQYTSMSPSSSCIPLSTSVYLSPDAETELDVNGVMPTHVVVGGIVDRTVTPGRSLRMSSKLSIPPRQLPLSSLNLDSLDSTEALNIDTVCEMVAFWRLGVNRGEEVGEAWKDAAIKAMCIHEERHPNRRIHKDGGKKKK